MKDRVGSMSREDKNVAFIACGNTQASESKAEGNPVVLAAEAKVVPSGVVRLMEFHKQGYAYLRPYGECGCSDGHVGSRPISATRQRSSGTCSSKRDPVMPEASRGRPVHNDHVPNRAVLS